MTAKEWREKNPNSDGNIRDYADVNELVCLSNLENVNSIYLNEGLSQKERLIKLNEIAISQMRILTNDKVDLLKFNEISMKNSDMLRENYLEIVNEEIK